MTALNQSPMASRGLKTLLSVVLCAALVGSGYGVFLVLASMKQPPASREVPLPVANVDVFDVERSDLQEILSSFGTAKADREVLLTAQVAGEIVEVHPRLEVGQPVQAPDVRVGAEGQSQRSPGDLLLRIDPKMYQERVTQAERRLAEDGAELARLLKEKDNNAIVLKQAEADVAAYRNEFDRVKTLHVKGVASDSDLTKSRLELQRYETALVKARNDQGLFPLQEEQLKRRTETHQSDIAIARLDLEHTEVRPPFDGVLSEVLVEQGQYVKAGEALVRLTDVSQIEIPVPVTLTDYAKIEPKLRAGQQPAVELAENETDPPRWNGYVVRAAPKADELTRTINVYVHVDNDRQAVPLLPGTFVHARIVGPVLQDVVTVPRDAIAHGKLFVARHRAGAPATVEQRSVSVKRTLRTLAILDGGTEPGTGVAAGDSVILTNLDLIHAGARIHIESHRTLADELQQQRTEIVRPVLAGDGRAQQKTVN